MSNSERVKQAKLEALRRRRAGLRKRRGDRLTRTIVLGTVTVLLALVWMIREFDLDVQELLGYLGVSALFVGALVLSGVLGFGVLWLFARARRRAAKPAPEDGSLRSKG